MVNVNLGLKESLTIGELTQKLSSYVAHNWKGELEKNRDELVNLFPEYEDATYGMYLDKLLPPAWKQVEEYGYKSISQAQDGDFVIAGFLNFRHSLEKAKWGNPAHEYRVFWITVENKVGMVIGTLLFELSHSHVQFDIPSPPKFSFSNKIEKKEIEKEILFLKENKEN